MSLDEEFYPVKNTRPRSTEDLSPKKELKKNKNRKLLRKKTEKFDTEKSIKLEKPT